jgi:hypothetical protein
MNELLLTASGRRPLHDPAAQLRALEHQRNQAADDGDVELVAAIDQRLDELVSEARERIAAEKREVREAFSAGTRRPVPPPRPSVSAQANEWILRASGRAR